MHLLYPYLYEIISFLENIYKTGLLLFLIISFFSNETFRKETYNWMYVFNFFIGWIYFFSLLVFCKELLMAWYGQNPYEWYAFGNKGVSAYGGVMWVYFLIIPAFGSLLLFRKLKSSRLFTVFFLMIVWLPSLMLLIANLYSDYQPSSWTSGIGENILSSILVWIITALLIILGYWIMNKRKKLPFPSLFLK